jgi:aldehyde dehydrogenase (NAD+)
MEGSVFAGYIDGRFVRGEGEALTVEDPSSGAVFKSFPGLSTGQIGEAVQAARGAFDDGRWSGLAFAQRRAILQRFSAALAARAEQVTELVVKEAGCPRAASVMQAQVHTPLRQANDILDLFGSLPELEENPLPLAERINALGQTVQSLRRYAPVGVVAGIAAYNFPFYTALWKVMPALAAGNTVVLRPSPLTPLSAMVFAEAAQEAELPPGVLNVVLEGDLKGGRLLTIDPAVDMVAFTGSSHVGVQVMVQAAPTMKRLQLELGGKSAQIFLPDAVDRASMAAAIVCLSHAGQGCALGTRIFVPNERKEEVLKGMAAAMSRIRVGPADHSETQMGPVISAAQVARCEHYVHLATEYGARVVTGGKRPAHLDKGFFFEPTLLDVPDNRNPAAQDEIFGPVVSVIGYRDLDHAVEMANDSRFGLSGYVHGQDRQAALRVALRIRSGTLNVNTGVASAYASSGGQRMSGIGRERGIEGLRVYQQLSCLNLGG